MVKLGRVDELVEKSLRPASAMLMDVVGLIGVGLNEFGLVW